MKIERMMKTAYAVRTSVLTPSDSSKRTLTPAKMLQAHRPFLSCPFSTCVRARAQQCARERAWLGRALGDDVADLEAEREAELDDLRDEHHHDHHQYLLVPADEE